MKRLTEKDWKDKCAGYPWNVHPVKNIDDLPYYKKLAAYEDAEEQGLILRLPCKVSDAVYVLTQNAIKKEIVRDVQYRGQTYADGQRWFLNVGALLYCENDIGKTVFLTKEEAEAKLAEMEGSHDGE